MDMPSRLRSLVVVSKATTPSVAMGTVTRRISTAWLLRALCARQPPPTTPIIRDYIVFYDAFEAVSIIYGALTLFESVIDETRIISSDNRYLVFEAPGKIHLHSYIVHSVVAACCMGFGMAHIYTMERVDLFTIPLELAPFLPPDLQGARDYFFSFIDIISGCTLASSTFCWFTFFVLILQARGQALPALRPPVRHVQPAAAVLQLAAAGHDAGGGQPAEHAAARHVVHAVVGAHAGGLHRLLRLHQHHADSLPALLHARGRRLSAALDVRIMDRSA